MIFCPILRCQPHLFPTPRRADHCDVSVCLFVWLCCFVVCCVFVVCETQNESEQNNEHRMHTTSQTRTRTRFMMPFTLYHTMIVISKNERKFKQITCVFKSDFSFVSDSFRIFNESGTTFAGGYKQQKL